MFNLKSLDNIRQNFHLPYRVLRFCIWLLSIFKWNFLVFISFCYFTYMSFVNFYFIYVWNGWIIPLSLFDTRNYHGINLALMHLQQRNCVRSRWYNLKVFGLYEPSSNQFGHAGFDDFAVSCMKTDTGYKYDYQYCHKYYEQHFFLSVNR